MKQGENEPTDPLLRLIRLGAETRATEYKESQPFELLKWKIVKSCMAMANLREGGRIIVGVAQRDGRTEALGMHPNHESDYTQDSIFELVNRHARPAVSLTVRFVEETDGRRFVGIEVAPFDRIPVFRHNATPPAAGRDGLRVGDIPARSRDRIATSRLYDADLVAEIIEVAAESRARDIIATAQRIGLTLPDQTQTLFERERQDFGDFG